MRFPERMLLKLPDGTLGRIDVVAGGGRRSEFIRGAIEAALGGGSVSGIPRGSVARDRSVAPKVSVKPVPRGLRPDAIALLDLVRERSVSARDAGEELGWFEMRVSRAENELLGAGLVRIAGGLLVHSG